VMRDRRAQVSRGRLGCRLCPRASAEGGVDAEVTRSAQDAHAHGVSHRSATPSDRTGRIERNDDLSPPPTAPSLRNGLLSSKPAPSRRGLRSSKLALEF
jgi:hypothetical protein